MDSSDKRMVTAIHEAGHAVVSHLLGLQILFVTLIDDSCGQTVPESTGCHLCEDYHRYPPAPPDNHFRRIEKEFWYQAAVASAGEITERVFFGEDHKIDPNDLIGDQEKLKNRIFIIHGKVEPLCSPSTCLHY